MARLSRTAYRAELDASLDRLLADTRQVELRDLARALPDHFDFAAPGPVALAKILKTRGWRKLEQPGPAMFVLGEAA